MAFGAAKITAIIDSIIDDAEAANQHARNLGAPFSAFFTQIDALVQTLGSKGKPFAERLADIQKIENYEPRYQMVRSQNPRLLHDICYQWMVANAVGFLQGIKKSIEQGLMSDIEDLVASQVYYDIFDEAKELLDHNHRSCAAVLMRIGLENGLRRVARREGMPDADRSKVSVVNQWLWKQGTYHQASFEMVESWLVIGNTFAHGGSDAEKITNSDIAKSIDGVRDFLGRIVV